VQLKVRGLILISQLAENVCEVTYVLNFVDKVYIPVNVLNTKLISGMAAINFLKDAFERSGLQVDQELRDAFVQDIGDSGHVDNGHVIEPMRGLVDESCKWVVWKKVKNNADKSGSNQFLHPNPTHQLSQLETKYYNNNIFVDMQIHEDKSGVWGKAEAIIDTSAAECLAWSWDVCSNESVRQNSMQEKLVIKAHNERHITFQTLVKPFGKLPPCEYVNDMYWGELEGGKFALVFKPSDVVVEYGQTIIR